MFISKITLVISMIILCGCTRRYAVNENDKISIYEQDHSLLIGTCRCRGDLIAVIEVDDKNINGPAYKITKSNFIIQKCAVKYNDNKYTIDINYIRNGGLVKEELACDGKAPNQSLKGRM